MNEQVKVSFLKNMIKRLDKESINEISFEFLVGSCFPHIIENIKTELREQYTKGYSAGLKEKKE